MAATTTPLLPLGQGPRIIVYHQTHHAPNNGPPISILPLITHATGATHVMIAAIHLNDPPGSITLNDLPPSDPKFTTLWAEVAWLQASGIKVLAMLGGAAKGTFARLDGAGNTSAADFEAHYLPLRDLLRAHRFDGVDLDIEEPMTLAGGVRLIDRLRRDFGPDFVITLAPVATALLRGQPHLSGPEFDYAELERLRGPEIAWYNAQFYCGWGDASTTAWYDAIVREGWKAEKVVMGLVTTPANGAGHVEWARQEGVLRALRARYPDFGGVMGWEYFNSLPGGVEKPWEWAANMARTIRTKNPLPAIAAPDEPTAIARPFGMPAQMPRPQHNFPAEHVKTLRDLGFNEMQAVAALNATGGNVEYAAGLLFQE